MRRDGTREGKEEWAEGGKKEEEDGDGYCRYEVV